MRIILYVNNLSRKSTNATAITILAKDLSDYLISQKHDVLIVGHKDIVEDDIKAPYVALHKGIFNGDIPYAKRLSDIIKDFKPDVIHAFMKPMSINLSLSTFFYKDQNAMYIGSIHNANNYMYYHKKSQIPYRILVNKLFSRLDYITAPSYAILEDIQKAYFIKDKTAILPNFINFERIENMAKEDIEEELNDYFINVGRLDEQKNQELLIKTFREVLKVFPNEKLVIIGDGLLKDRLKSLIKELSLENNVFLLGYKQNPWKYYKMSKAFLLSSMYEGFGLVLLEAMYFKTPIISFDIKASREVTEDGKYGILVKSFDDKAFKDVIIKFLEGYYDIKSLKENAYKRALEFSLDNYLNTLKQLAKY